MKLRPFERRDIGPLLNQFTTPEELRFWCGNSFRFPLSAEQLHGHQRANRKDKGALLFTAADTGGRMIGYGEIGRFSPNRSAFLSRIVILKEFRNRQFGHALVRALLAHAFETRRLHRLELNVCEDNHSAIRCYEKAGFVREGLLRDALDAGDGRFLNEYRMSILRPEYERWR